jgi:hypothetical protein
MNYSAKADSPGSVNWFSNLKEAFWHTIAYTLNIDVFVVHSTAARIVIGAYCFLVRPSEGCPACHRRLRIRPLGVFPGWGRTNDLSERLTVAWLNIAPLGAIGCGESIRQLKKSYVF